MAKPSVTEVKNHINSVLGDRTEELRTGWEEYIKKGLQEIEIPNLLTVTNQDNLINTINSWMRDDGWNSFVPIPKKEGGENEDDDEDTRWPLIEAIIDWISQIQLKNTPRNLLRLLVFFVVVLIVMTIVNNPTSSIDFGGKITPTIEKPNTLPKWDWSVFEVLSFSFNKENKVHLYAGGLVMIILINIIQDARDNEVGSNWASIFGTVVFVFSLVPESPLESAGIVLGSCLLQRRDRDSAQSIWAGPALILLILVSYRWVGNSYINLPSENFWGAVRAILHLAYSIPPEWRFVINCSIILIFSVLAVVSQDNRIDNDGQVSMHVLLSAYAFFVQALPYTTHVEQFNVGGKWNLVTGFGVTNAIFALILGFTELNFRGDVDGWKSIVGFIKYTVISGFLTILLSTFFNWSLFSSLLIGMALTKLDLGWDRWLAEGKSVSRAIRNLTEKDSSGYWRVGPVMIPNTYVGINMTILYICTIAVKNFTVILSNPFPF